MVDLMVNVMFLDDPTATSSGSKFAIEICYSCASSSADITSTLNSGLEKFLLNDVPREEEMMRITRIITLHCWMIAEHPDPEGNQMRLIVSLRGSARRGLGYSNVFDDVAIFGDWASIGTCLVAPALHS